MRYVLEPGPRPSVSVLGSDARFPVRRVYCVGRNYADHAKEMGHDPSREPPFFFSKPADDLVSGITVLDYPRGTANLHPEVELVVAIGEGGAGIPTDTSLDHVFGYGVGLDMTKRDVQEEAKRLRRPWDMAKGFDRSAVVSELAPVSDVGHPATGSITLSVNGEARQISDLGQQIWSVAEVISHLSEQVLLAPGDLILTGTPAGVQAVERGDQIRATVAGVGQLDLVYR